MRKGLFWLGWAVLFGLPVIYVVTAIVIQDLPRVEPWKWGILFGAVVLVFLARNRDEVLKHHVV